MYTISEMESQGERWLKYAFGAVFTVRSVLALESFHSFSLFEIIFTLSIPFVKILIFL